MFNEPIPAWLQLLGTVLVAAISSIATLAAARFNSKSNLTKTNNENAISLFDQYKELNEQLQKKVDRLEEKLERLQEKYEKEIDYYQAEVERLENENDRLQAEVIELTKENTILKGSA